MVQRFLLSCAASAAARGRSGHFEVPDVGVGVRAAMAGLRFAGARALTQLAIARHSRTLTLVSRHAEYCIEARKSQRHAGCGKHHGYALVLATAAAPSR